jgi:hypothetical protein
MVDRLLWRQLDTPGHEIATLETVDGVQAFEVTCHVTGTYPPCGMGVVGFFTRGARRRLRAAAIRDSVDKTF